MGESLEQPSLLRDAPSTASNGTNGVWNTQEEMTRLEAENAQLKAELEQANRLVKEYCNALGKCILEREQAKREILKWKRIRTPTHGNCCTCQACGLHHDDCRCDLDDVADELSQAKQREARLRNYIISLAEIKNLAGHEYWDGYQKACERILDHMKEALQEGT